MKRLVLPLAFVVLLGFWPSLGVALVILVGCTTNAMGQPLVTNKLVDVNTSTGLLSNPRDIGLYYLTGIATQPGTGNLFGLTST